jgi:hypothetical protein
MKAIVFVLLLVASNTLFANVCEVKSGVIKLAGSETLYEKEGWIDDCSGTIELVSDQAEICLFNQLKQWNCTVRRKRDGVIAVNALQIDSEYATGFFAALKSLFDPDTDMEFGGMRLKDDEPLPGFPYSEILQPLGTMQLNIARATPETISRFALLDVELNQEIFAFDNPAKIVSIPASLFKPGKSYRWWMQAPSKQYEGDFSVVATEDQQEFERDFNSAQPEGGLPDTAKDLLRAVIAREYGYTFDYQQSLYKARQSIAFEQAGATP